MCVQTSAQRSARPSCSSHIGGGRRDDRPGAAGDRVHVPKARGRPDCNSSDISTVVADDSCGKPWQARSKWMAARGRFSTLQCTPGAVDRRDFDGWVVVLRSCHQPDSFVWPGLRIAGQRRCLSHEGSENTQGKCGVLATKAVRTHRAKEDSVLATKAVETQGNGSVLPATSTRRAQPASAIASRPAPSCLRTRPHTLSLLTPSTRSSVEAPPIDGVAAGRQARHWLLYPRTFRYC